MSKKAIKKITSAFTFGVADKVLGGPDPAAEAAKKAARAQEEQARQQAQQAAEAAAQAQRQVTLDAERQQLQQAAAEQQNQNVSAETPTVTLAGEEDIPIQSKRNRFRTSVGGKTSASVRV